MVKRDADAIRLLASSYLCETVFLHCDTQRMMFGEVEFTESSESNCAIYSRRAKVTFGYPKEAAQERELTPRFPQACIHFKNGYRRLDETDLKQMLEPRDRETYLGSATNIGQHYYVRKFAADFSVEMTRSVRQAIQTWTADDERASQGNSR